MSAVIERGLNAGRRTQCLLCIGLLVLAFAVWRVAIFVPVPGAPSVARGPAATQGMHGSAGASAYTLEDGEAVRYVPQSDAAARRRVLQESEWPDCQDLFSMTVVWDGAARVQSVESGWEMVPRPLVRVLRDSLEIPVQNLEGIEVARRIGLSGDWIVRADADLSARMSDLEAIVQRSGYPGFRMTRSVTRRTGYVMQGAAMPPHEPIEILELLPEVLPVRSRTGSLLEFGAALSAAIQRPVSVDAEPRDLSVSWRDNSRAYVDLDRAITDKMISNVLNDASASLGLTFETVEVEMPVWRLEMSK